MNIYQITYSPMTKEVHLNFWGCNFACRGCLRRKEMDESHLRETRDIVFKGRGKPVGKPTYLPDIVEVKNILKKVDLSRVIFMGMEPTLDPELPELAEFISKDLHGYNVLLTNGLRLIPLENMDEVVISIKAYLDDVHRGYTGVSNKKVLENFVSIYQSGIRLRSESVFIPGYIDFREIGMIAQFISEVDKDIPYRIDAYSPIGDSPWRRPTIEEMKKAVSLAQRYLSNVSCLTGYESLKSRFIKIF